MDEDLLSLLETVCVAGRARSGFNGKAHAQLEKLVEEGLLDAENASPSDTDARVPRRYYRPTEQGWAMCRKLTKKGVA